MKYVSWVCGLLALIACGCGGGEAADAPELFEAHGTVTLDGNPLPNAQVLFYAENQAPVSGLTNEEGYYVIQYNDKVDGAFPGKNVVRIQTGSNQAEDPDDDDDEDEAEEKRAALQVVPAKYNAQTELSVDVKQGGAPYDFALKSS